MAPAGIFCVKLLQLNVWGGRLMKPLLELLEGEQADFLCLQEAISFDGEIHSLLGTIEEMQSKLSNPYRELYYSPGIRFNFMHKNAQWGNAILSRFPILEKETEFTHLSYIDNFNFDDYDYNARNFQHCVIKTESGKSLNVLNHHGYHIPDHKNGNQETLRQMNQIVEYVNGLAGPVILTGDFNLAPHSQSLEVLNKKLNNLSMNNRLITTRTTLTSKVEVCDYIFVSDEIKVDNFYASDEVVSDHKALILEFSL
jgi:endonuclease/exonuclease/phosphatase family metal-dependent hydrolase